MAYFVEGLGEVKLDNINLSSFYKYVENLVTDVQHLRSCRLSSKKTVLKLVDLLMNVIKKMVKKSSIPETVEIL